MDKKEHIYVDENGYLIMHDPASGNTWTLQPRNFVGKLKDKNKVKKLGEFRLSY